VIYEQQIWQAGNPTSQWKYMADRGSATTNHHVHVHVDADADALGIPPEPHDGADPTEAVDGTPAV